MTFRPWRRIRELEQALAAAAAEARTDPLTGLPNRRAFYEQLQAERGPVTVALIDVNGFKEINDSMGHETGDQVLAAVAASLRDRTRSMDFLARIGGDEFVILLRRTSRTDAERVALDIESIQPGGMSVSVGVGSGGAMDAITEADRLMYERKRSGKLAA